MTGTAPQVCTHELPVSATGRIIGVDAARAFALVGMFATHLLPLRDAAGRPTLTGLLADGRASALFAVLAGVGIALGTGGQHRPPDARAHLAAGAALLVRGALVMLLGLALGGLDPFVAVVLAYYGLLFAIAVPLLRLPAGALAAGAVLMCGLGPALSQLLRAGLPPGPGEQPGLGALGDPGELFTTLLLTGYYPVLPWTTYLLAGMAVGRLDLRRARTAVGLLGGGVLLAAVAAGASALLLGPGGGAAALGAAALERRRFGTTPTDSWWWLAVDAPHSGAPLALAGATGTALAVLGAMLLLARWARPLVWVPAAVGAVPLTLYTAHVIVVAAYPDAHGTVLVWAGHVAAAVAVGVAVALTGSRGPLEAGISTCGRAVRRALTRT